MLFDTISYVAGADWNYDISGSTLSTPSDGDVITRFVATREFTLPTNLAGYQFTSSNPSSTATITIKQDGSSIGTISVSTGGVPTPTVTQTSFATNEVLTIEVTTAGGIDDIGITLKTLAA